MPRQQLNYSVYYEEEAYSCRVDVSYHIDPDYGANADGRYGYRRVFIDDAHIMEITSEIGTMPMNEIPDELREKILIAIDEHL